MTPELLIAVAVRVCRDRAELLEIATRRAGRARRPLPHAAGSARRHGRRAAGRDASADSVSGARPHVLLLEVE
jgi:hypothetical protein